MGAAAGALAVFWLGMKWRARADRLEEEKLRLAQEKQIVVDFMHHMLQALGEGLSREELFQRIVHAAILCTEALSACIFEKRADNKMQGVAVEGLFPPHRPLPSQARTKLATRARFIEQVLKSEVFDISEGIVGRVARTGQGELIADAASDPRIVKHDDPSLAVRSVIGKSNDQHAGVNDEHGQTATPLPLPSTVLTHRRGHRRGRGSHPWLADWLPPPVARADTPAATGGPPRHAAATPRASARERP